ncbi:MAG: hypothetical protein DRO67_06090 [Candidatus Asgardarchaeum californiense]|nr:MAG: hypothetical protein DRO67_06090 [Candidatus Asgardarchaeum californiense]
MGKCIRKMMPEYVIELHKDEKKIMKMVSDEVLRTIFLIKNPNDKSNIICHFNDYKPFILIL